MGYRQYAVEDFVLDESFQQWVKGGNPEAKAFWELWILQHPEKAAVVEEAKQTLQALHFATDPLTPERQLRMHSRIMEGVQAYEREKIASPAQESRRLWASLLSYRAAAAVGVLAVIGAVLGWYLTGLHRQVEYVTGFGQTKTVVLPDGSEVVLNANSTLMHPAGWTGGNNREVWLQGEAFFNVRKNVHGNSPVKFTVHSGSLRVEVLGTEFTVSRRQDRTQVVLSEGSVRLALPGQAGTDPIVMQPGELVEYREEDHAVARRNVKAEVYHSWKYNRWILENVTLGQVANRIGETYGLEVRIPDPRLAQESMTGVLPTDSLDKLLRVLSATYDIQVQRKENRLILTK
jgi:ferric-dicitrate binding protein FerR (iron transport regulator)